MFLQVLRDWLSPLASYGPDAPDPATARDADIISYRDDVPGPVYLGGGLGLSLFILFVWATASSTLHHVVDPSLFIGAAVVAWPLCFIWMHWCLTSRYPEVPYIWCDARTVSIEGCCRVPWERLVTIKPILRHSQYGNGPYAVGVTLGYIGPYGLETVRIRNARASGYMESVCQDLRERAVAAGAKLQGVSGTLY